MSFASVTAFAARRGHPSVPPQTPPVFTSAPVISGTPTVTFTLSYTPGLYTGNPNPSSGQQWTRDGVDIALATGATYTLVGADATHQVGVRQIATNVLGSASSSSSSVTVSGGTAPSFTTSPAILGTPSVGVASAYNQGSVSGFPPPTITQQWTLDGVDIGSATGATYTPISGNATHLLRVRQIATNTVGSASSTSAAQTVQAATVIGTQTALALSAPTTGTYPYSAAAYMLRGDVPSGYVIDSPDDSTLRSSILSTWDDGSASVVVVSGATALTANAIKMVALRPVTSASGTNLTTAAITSAVTSVAVSFTATYGGTATLSTFTAPERIWWTNPQVICARYRLAAPTPGTTKLEAVIDIHAYVGGRAFVEVVVENAKVTIGSATSPAAASYTGMTVSVNGTTIATVNKPATTVVRGTTLYATATHQEFRAWYASTWIGGDPGVVVTHDTNYLQMHPLMMQIDQPSNQDFSRTDQAGFGNIPSTMTYTPWTIGDLRPSAAAGGDDVSIGAFTKWDTQYLQTGNKYARNAVIVNALAALSYPINYRDSTTGVVPTLDQTMSAGVYQQFGLPAMVAGSSTPNSNPYWEGEHPPTVGLMAFLCRPSPVFIELAQKAGFYAFTSVRADGLFTSNISGRNKAWSVRNLLHAAFLTPSQLPSGGSRATSEVTGWRTAGRDCLGRVSTQMKNSWVTSPLRLNPLHAMWGGTPNAGGTEEAWDETGGSGFDISLWHQGHWCNTEFYRLECSRILSGTPATDLSAFLDWALQLAPKMINESTGGEWRFQSNRTTIGVTGGAGNGIDAGDPAIFSDWGAAYLWRRGAAPPSSGMWQYNFGGSAETSYSSGVWVTPEVTSSNYYSVHLWHALTVAQERGITGASTAWTRVLSSITNIDQWRSGFASEPRTGTYSRSTSGGKFLNAKWPAWRRAMVPGTWAKVGSVMNLANPLNNAALNPLGAGVVGTWQNIPPGPMNLETGPAGTEGFSAVVDDWCGGAFNPADGRLYIPAGGGHNGYGGNEVLSIDPASASPAWRLERPPTGAIGFSQGIILADKQESSRIYSNGDPRASHTYGLIAWAGGSMYSCVSASFCNPDGNSERNGLQKLFRFTPHASANGTSNFGTWAHVATLPSSTVGTNWNSTGLCYDSTRNAIIVFGPNARAYSWVIGSGTSFTTAAGSGLFDADLRPIYVAALDLVIISTGYPSTRFQIFKPSTGTFHTPSITGTPPAPIAEPTKGNGSIVGEYFTAADWVPSLGAMVVHAEGGSALTGFHTLTPPVSGDPTTTAWAWGRLEASAANTVTPDNRNFNGDYGRFFHSPSLNCLGYVSSTTSGSLGNPNSTGSLNIFALP